MSGEDGTNMGLHAPKTGASSSQKVSLSDWLVNSPVKLGFIFNLTFLYLTAIHYYLPQDL
jgi:hypothetical protein